MYSDRNCVGLVFKSLFYESFSFQFLTVPMFQNETMKCLTELAGVTVPDYDDKFIAMLNEILQKLDTILPVDINLKDVFNIGSDAEQIFIQNMAMF